MFFFKDFRGRGFNSMLHSTNRFCKQLFALSIFVILSHYEWMIEGNINNALRERWPWFEFFIGCVSSICQSLKSALFTARITAMLTKIFRFIRKEQNTWIIRMEIWDWIFSERKIIQIPNWIIYIYNLRLFIEIQVKSKSISEIFIFHNTHSLKPLEWISLWRVKSHF